MRARSIIRYATLIAVALVCSSCAGTMRRETPTPEERQRIADAQAVAHEQANRYAAVVYFDVGSAVVGEDGQRELRWFVEQMQLYPDAVIQVKGFADTAGEEAQTPTLFEDRARAVASFLNAEGIAPARIIMQGFGKAPSAVADATAEDRRTNRRVEVTVR
jgi:outer membrane protein OmpA-like peptidoglycan-associated protein